MGGVGSQFGLYVKSNIANDIAPVPVGAHGALKWMKRAFQRIADGYLTGAGALQNLKDSLEGF